MLPIAYLGGDWKLGVFSEDALDAGVSHALLREPIVSRRVERGGDDSITGVGFEHKEPLRAAGRRPSGADTAGVFAVILWVRPAG